MEGVAAMSKRYNEPIMLQVSPGQEPQGFVWRGRRYQIESVIKRWTVNGEWWKQPDNQRLHAVVTARARGQSGQYEIVYLKAERKWILRHVYD
jgi:hypothetical protein